MGSTLLCSAKFLIPVHRRYIPWTRDKSTDSFFGNLAQRREIILLNHFLRKIVETWLLMFRDRLQISLSLFFCNSGLLVRW
jgi:hypothetical protein